MTTNIKPKPFNQIKQEDIENNLLSGPGQDLVKKTLEQMAKVDGFVKIFGAYKPQSNKGNNDQRWADYQRFDWSVRQLPAICVFEGGSEAKDSDNGFLTGEISFQIFWPPNFRRSDSRRVEVIFKGALENFFSSKYVKDMLDEIYWIERSMKVSGLNQYGNSLTWNPNTEALVEDQLVPITIFSANYKIDLRSWYRALEFNNRTKDEPFKETLSDLTEIGSLDASAYIGIDDNNNIEIEIPDKIQVSNP